MGNPSHNRSFWSTVIALLVTGFGIGWLAGLSVSPVIAMIISSLLATAAAVITVLSGLETSSSDPMNASKLRQFLGLNVNPWPIALLVIGIIGGSVLGISVRTNNWLSPKAPVAPTVLEEVNQWVDAGVADRSEVARRILRADMAIGVG